MFDLQYEEMAARIPEGAQDDARVVHLEVSEKEASFTALRAAVTGRPGEQVAAGRYIQLYVGNQLMMSDTQMERDTNMGALFHSKGAVLIAGLGVGLILPPILAKKDVTSVVVVEKSAGVITLVEPHVRHPKLTVVQGDIFNWKPPRGTVYDAVYFDIWPEITTANLPEMTRLHRRFRKYLRPEGWMDSWRRGYLKTLQSRWKRQWGGLLGR